MQLTRTAFAHQQLVWYRTRPAYTQEVVCKLVWHTFPENQIPVQPQLVQCHLGSRYPNICDLVS